MINDRYSEAIKVFNSGFNCTQSVVSAHLTELRIEEELAMSLSSGFGGGMGRLQNTCGAVTGSFMVIGIHNTQNIKDPDERKEDTIKKIQQFEKLFKAKHGKIDCRSLLNCDLNTEEGQQYFNDNDLGKKVCENCIKDSIEIIEKLLEH